MGNFGGLGRREGLGRCSARVVCTLYNRHGRGCRATHQIVMVIVVASEGLYLLTRVPAQYCTGFHDLYYIVVGS
jgi:hypothetical protein